jgi:hypothetical protein
MKSVAIKRGGQKPRAGVRRYKDGSIVRSERLPRETEDDTKATALEARLRRELGVEAWLAARGTPKALREARRAMDEPLLSDKNPLGWLLLVGRRDAAAGITQDQYDAGQFFRRLHRLNAVITNPQREHPVAIGADLVGNATEVKPADEVSHYEDNELDPDRAVDHRHEQEIRERIAKVKSRWLTLYGFIMEADAQRGEVFSILRKVLIECSPPESMAELGALRTGLNAVNRARGV